MAGVCPQRHTDCGQEGQLDTQDKPDLGSQTERQDPPSSYVDPCSFD